MSDDKDDDKKNGDIPESNKNWNVIPFGDFDIDKQFDESQEKFIETEKTTDHVLEDVFDIEENSTIVPYVERTPTVLVDHPSYDEKDKELEEQFQEVIDYAFEAFENSSEAANDVEPQYKARNQEVAAQFLDTALKAITAKADHKQKKDKLEKMVAVGKGGGTTNNIIVDRNDLLRALRSQDDPIEGEFSESE